MPNAENCSEKQLMTAANASPSKAGFVRLWCLRCLILGRLHEHVAKLADVTLETLSLDAECRYEEPTKDSYHIPLMPFKEHPRRRPSLMPSPGYEG
jgi:hypothetical protein